MPDGGYDSGYRNCPCFWGRQPGRLVSQFLKSQRSVAGLRVLDAGCGEGKNALAFSQAGAVVTAVECSEFAIEHARKLPNSESIDWVQADIRTQDWPSNYFDIVVAYGLLHCLDSQQDIAQLVTRLQTATRLGGAHIICTFNDRRQDIAKAHPDFRPCLLNHDQYLRLYRGWTIINASDEDLVETHPHNLIEHTHSLTRLYAEKAKHAGMSART